MIPPSAGTAAAMTTARTTLVAARALIGAGASLAPRATARLIGVHLPERVPQLYTDRLFGTRELALAWLQGTAQGEERERLRTLGITVDLLDAGWAVVAGVRGHLPARTALFWTAAGLGAAALGVLAGREEG